MITTVTLNPSLDTVLELKRFLPNHYNLVEKVSRVSGGKGINISKAVRAYGLDTMALGFLGGHTGHFIAEQLRDFGITTNFWHIAEETRANVIIFEHLNKNSTLLSGPGPKITKRDLEHFQSIFSRSLAQSKLVALSGSLPSEVPDDIYYQLIELAHQRNVPAILDAAGIPFEKGIEAKPLVAKPDLRASAHKVFGKIVNNQDTAIKIAQEIVSRGIQIAIVSFLDGKAIIANKDEIWLAESIADKIVNIIGADEAVIAGFAIKLVEEEKEEIPSIIHFAMACGLASALTEDEEFHSKEDVIACLPVVKETKLI